MKFDFQEFSKMTSIKASNWYPFSFLVLFIFFFGILRGRGVEMKLMSLLAILGG